MVLTICFISASIFPSVPQEDPTSAVQVWLCLPSGALSLGGLPLRNAFVSFSIFCVIVFIIIQITGGDSTAEEMEELRRMEAEMMAA